MKSQPGTTPRFPSNADILLALGTLIVPLSLVAEQMGGVEQPGLGRAVALIGALAMSASGPLVLRRALERRSVSLSRVLDRLMQLGLLTLLFVIPLAYSTRFSTTLILKETLSQTVAIFLLAVWLGRSVIRGELHYVKTPYNLVVGGLMVFALISLVWVQPKRTSARDLLLFASFWMLFHMYCLEMRHRGFRRVAFACVVVSGCIVAAISLAQLAHSPILEGTPYGMVWKQEDPRLRVASTIGHNISVATFFLGLAFIQLGWVLTVRKKSLAVLALLLFLVSSAVIFVSETRGVYVAFPMAIVFLVILLLGFRGQPGQAGWRLVRFEARRRLLLLVLLSGLGFSILGAVLTHGKRIDPLGRLATLRPRVLTPGTRVRLWTISAEMLRDFPLRGLGFQSFKYHYPFYQARYFAEHPDTRMVPTGRHTDRVHNEYLQVWVELGAVGLVLTLLLLLVHGRFVWRQTRRASGRLGTARDDLFRTVLVAGIGGALVDAFFHFYIHVTSDVLMLIFLLSAVVALSRPLCIKVIRIPGYAKRPGLARGMLVCLGLAAVAVAVFGPGVVGVFVPQERFLEESRGPIAHALADALYTPEERSLEGRLRRLGVLRMLARNPDEASLRQILGPVRDLEVSAERFGRCRTISGYRGQVSFYAGQCFARLGEIYSQLGPLEERVGWHRAAEESRRRFGDSFKEARDHLHQATEEYQFRHIYYELAKVDYYLAALESRGDDRQKSRELFDEAEVCFRTAARIYPRSLEYHHDLAKFLLSVRKDFSGALEEWKRAFRVDPEFVDTHLLAEAKAQEQVKNLRMAEWLYRAAFELAKEFLRPRREVDYALLLCRFYSDHGMPDQLEQVVRELNVRHPDRTDAFGLAAHYLTQWNRSEQAEQMIFDQLEKRPLDILLVTKCEQIDDVYRRDGKSELTIPFWQKVARYAAEPEVAPYLYLQLGYRSLSVGRNPAASFAAFSTAAQMAADVSPENRVKSGGTFQDTFFSFLLPIVLR